MLMLHALRNRNVSFLWVGQILSSVGDEIYRVALLWLAVGLIGANTGYLAAGQSVALLALSIVGGKKADGWNSLNTMIGVDLLRGSIVLLPVFLHYFIPASLSVLIFVALTLSALSAFFDPALQATLPSLCSDAKTLKAANGLMSITARFARVMGPAIVGFLSAFVPIIHFFTMDALSFFASAYSVSLIKRKALKTPEDTIPQSPPEGFYSVLKIIRAVPRMRYIMFAKGMTSAAWSVSYSLGFALLVTEMASHNVKSFSLVIASYGAGNFLGSLFFANVERKKPAQLMFLGYMWLGVGFFLVGVAPTLHLVMGAAVLAAFGGPMNDVAFVDLMQNTFVVGDLTKIFRFRMASETLGTLICMSLVPVFLKFATVHSLIELCGIIIFVLGSIGLYLLQKATFTATPTS